MTLNEWEQSNIEVLTSREMGEWLSRRENRLLDKIKSEVLTIPQIDSDGHNNNWYREPQAIIDDVIDIIDKHIGDTE